MYLQLAAAAALLAVHLWYPGCTESRSFCHGNVTPCSQYDEDECSEHEGCSLRSECFEATPDAGADAGYQCHDLPEEECLEPDCQWWEGCRGEPESCGSYSTKKTCEAREECSWATTTGV